MDKAPLKSNQSRQLHDFFSGWGCSSVFGAGALISGCGRSFSGSAGVLFSIVPPPGSWVVVV